MKLYHNARCQKSREALALLQEKGASPQIVLYMKEPLLPGDLETLLEKLAIPAGDLIRKKEKVWKDEFAEKELSEDELILAMIEYPQLMERPVLETVDKAIVGRPPEKVLELI